ncbi:MAG: hypothetical protein JOZ69_22425, partial [Myxococcales bacterium]|nr:hypothetical protein [Myxococcales bacterium]
MTLLALLGARPPVTRRDESTFERARRSAPALAPYPSTTALLAVLALDSPLSLEERQELVRALVALYRSTGDRLWPSLLVYTFRPMLLSLRARDRGPRDDRDSRVVLAFLQALARTPLAGQPVFLAVYRATARAVFQAVRAERAHAETLPLEEAENASVQPDGEPAPFVAALAREVASQVLANGGAGSLQAEPASEPTRRPSPPGRS